MCITIGPLGEEQRLKGMDKRAALTRGSARSLSTPASHWGRSVVYGAALAVCTSLSCSEWIALDPYAFVPTTRAAGNISWSRTSSGELELECPFFHINVGGGHSGVFLPVHVANTGDSVVEVDLPNARLFVLDDPSSGSPVVTAIASEAAIDGAVAGIVAVKPGETVDLEVHFSVDVSDLVYLYLPLKAGNPSAAYGLQIRYRAIN